MKFGAIDIGTNAARLLIGEILIDNQTEFINKIHYLRFPLRLGESVFESGQINPQKMKQFVDTMQIFQKVCDLFEVQTLRACATSAMREAQNSQEAVDIIREATGIEVEVISGQQEAQIIMDAFSLFDMGTTQVYVVVDVGGGSTEISVFESGQKTHSQSFEIGTLRLLKNKVNPNVYREMSAWILNNIVVNVNYLCYATGGNINKVHKLMGGKYLQAISLRKLKKMKNDLRKISLAQRMKRYQLKEDRAEVIVPALEIYCSVLETLKCKKVIVPKIGLSDGIIYDLYQQNLGTHAF